MPRRLVQGHSYSKEKNQIISFENMQSQKRLIASQLKPRKGKDIKLILIENKYSLSERFFGMKSNNGYYFFILIN